MKARIIIGANYGDEGKGTVVANYTNKAILNGNKVLNILTNGGAQRGHSIIKNTGEGINVSHTFQHFGSGTYHGADTYYSCYFILNPMQFVKEYNELLIKPGNIYREYYCRWSTPYDSMANLIEEQLRKRKASCGMGIWNTIKRYNEDSMPSMGIPFNQFMALNYIDKVLYLNRIREYYEKFLSIPDEFKNIWRGSGIIEHFIKDCEILFRKTSVIPLSSLYYDEMIFENGQGLLLCDKGKDTYDTTPSNTGMRYARELLSVLNIKDITAHYVTRPYLTRHGDGEMLDSNVKSSISSGIQEDRTNHYNDFQGNFRYGELDIPLLKQRILDDVEDTKFILEVTHCDEMDRIDEFRKEFCKVNAIDSPII